MPTLFDADRKRGEPGAAEAAASWFARLRSDTVSVQDLIAFQAWRGEAKHDAAYRQVEALWARGETLRYDPDIALALSVALDGRQRPSAPRRSAAYLVAACVLIVLALGVWTLSAGYIGARTYETAVGQQRDVRLADGSVVRLDTHSRVHVRLGTAGRYLNLQSGRAFFTVAHDGARPFWVAAGHARVRAVGTRFSVEARTDDIRVVLIQGVVSVSSSRPEVGRAPVRMSAGQELVVDGAPGAPRAVDVSLATSWLQNQLVFRDVNGGAKPGQRVGVKVGQ